MEEIKEVFIGIGCCICFFIAIAVIGWIYPWSAHEIIHESNYAKSVLGSLSEFQSGANFAIFDLVTNWCDDSFFLLSMIGNAVSFIISVITLIINLIVSFFFHPLDFFIDPLCTIGTIIYAINQMSIDFVNIFTPLVSWLIDLFSNHLDSETCRNVRDATPTFMDTMIMKVISVF